MSRLHKIKIKNGDYDTGQLTLSDGGHTRANKTDYINWSIHNNAGNRVVSIIGIEKKSNNPDIFSIDPHANGAEWSAEIDNHTTYHTECLYSISWKGKDGNNYIHDPKISVKPSFELHHVILKVIETVLVILLGICTLKFLRKKSST